MVKVKHTGTRRYKERLVGLPWPRVSWVGGFLSPRDYADFKDVDMVIEALGLAGYFLGVFVMSQQCSIPRLIDYIYGLIQIYYPNSIQCIINYHDPWAGKSVLNQRAVFCFFFGFSFMKSSSPGCARDHGLEEGGHDLNLPQRWIYPLVNKHRPWKSPIFNGN
jgi:hypothetical protein